MKNYLDCYPCFLRQALSAARRAGASDDQQRQILLNTMQQLRALPADATPPQIAVRIHQLVRQQTNIIDPYRQAKDEATQQALALYPRLKEMVDKRQRIRWKRLYVLPSLVNSNSILYLADNAGETVFDRVLIETLELPVEPQGRIQ